MLRVIMLGVLGLAFVAGVLLPTVVSSRSALPWRPYHQLISEGTIKEAEQVIEVAIEWDDDQFALSSARIIRGYPPVSELVDGGYRLQAMDSDQGILYSMSFNPPDKIFGGPLQSEDEVQTIHGKKHVVKVKRSNLRLTLPFFARASHIALMDPLGNHLETILLPGTQKQESEPDFESIRGDEFMGQVPEGAGKLPPRMIPDYLDVTYIGHGYSQGEMGKFTADVDRFVAHLMSYSPFKDRASEILFHRVRNTSSLGCYYDSKMARLLVCDESVVTGTVNDSGAPHDTIVVIVNNSSYGGSGSRISVAYNGRMGPQVSVHEMGHTLGKLHDEYSLYGTGKINDKVARNCYAGDPPAKEWSRIVPRPDYARGCYHSNWHRSSRDSLMLSINFLFFNQVSVNLLDQEINRFVQFRNRIKE